MKKETINQTDTYEIDILNILRVLWSGKLIIIILTLISTLSTFLYYKNSENLFRSTYTIKNFNNDFFVNIS